MEKLVLDKGIIYYTDNRLMEPLYSEVQRRIRESKLPIVSASLKPMDLGDNEVVNGMPSYPTMVRQIVSCLKRSKTEFVFFCEHDVLYHKSHFDYVPYGDGWQYNDNVWRWKLGNPTAVRYDRMLSLSCLCVGRNRALEHYKMRLKKIEENPEEFTSREPQRARIWGYEPGTKKPKRGGLIEDNYTTWESELPVIDVRHRGTFSKPKVTLEEFKHKPTGWVEIDIKEIDGWDYEQELRPLHTHTC